MIEAARTKYEKEGVTFHQGQSEDLNALLPSGSVDLVISGSYVHFIIKRSQDRPYHLFTAQACHWFNWEKVWPEVTRILRTGGTAAFWVGIIPQHYINNIDLN